jgi:membrane protein
MAQVHVREDTTLATRPEPDEPLLPDPPLRDFSFRDWRAIFVRAFKDFLAHHGTMLASALAYSTFFAIPSVLLVVVGAFTLLVGPGTISALMAHFSHVMPGQATSLLGGSLHRLEQHPSTGVAMTIVGFVLALWSTTGAMTSYMTAINLAYERRDRRAFVRKRLVALELVAVIGLAFVLVSVLLIFGPPLERLAASHAGGASGAIGWIWWIADWPILVAGLVAAFAMLLHLGPDGEHPRWRFLTPGSLFATAVWLAASGRLCRLHVELRLVQQDVGVARSGDRDADLAVARGDRVAPRRRAQCRGRAEPRATESAAGALGLNAPPACSSARNRSR